MSVIFLDFYSNLKPAEKKYFNKNIYSTPLEEQFELINNRFPLDMRFENLKSFIENAFPSGFPKKYYISCPNFKREVIQGKSASFLRNVVIRADGKEIGRRLPNNLSVILVGDIIEGGVLKLFSVKGIELVDEGFTKHGESLIMNSYACTAFERNIWSIPRIQYSDTYFTPDVILSLIQSNYPVKNYEKVIRFYKTWDQYLSFREYYLKNQTKRHFQVANISYKEAFSINRKRYQKNRELYDEHMLDGHSEFSKGELVVLENELEDSEPFHLLRIDIDYNRLKFLEEVIEKGGRKVNKIEVNLRSFARDNLALSEFPPNNDKYSDQLKSGLQLDQRFKIVKKEIEPDCSDLEQRFSRMIKEAQTAIDFIYDKRIERETAEATLLKKQEIEAINSGNIATYFDELTNRLDADVSEMKDTEIKSKYQQRLDAIVKSLKKEVDTQVATLNKRLGKEKDKDKIKAIQLEINELSNVYANEIKHAGNNIDVRQMFVERNATLIQKRTNQLEEALKRDVKDFENNYKKKLIHQYQLNIREEKAVKKVELETELKSLVEDRIEQQTIVRFSLYFKSDIDNQGTIKKALNSKKYGFLIYNNRAEQAKIERQRNALESFFEGNVKNPYLSTYLFSPEDLEPNITRNHEWNWFLDKLNDKQKEAVQKAVSSNGVFLLQGPPGTGKTQVISEIVGHLIKEGKRVLISSETHKAIDNVFERLPKIAEIRPIRLMTSQSGKDSDYSPENLVDNLYYNIAEQMKKTIRSYENFTEYRDTFDSEFKELKLLNQVLNNNKTKSDEISREISRFEIAFNELKEERSRVYDRKEVLVYEKDKYLNTYKKILNHQFGYDEDLDMAIIETYKTEVAGSIDTSIFNTSQIDTFIRLVFMTKPLEINDELKIIQSNKASYELEEKRKQLLTEIMTLMENEDDNDHIIKQKRQELIAIKKQIDNSDSDLDLTNMIIGKIFNSEWLKNHQAAAIESFEKLQIQIINLRNTHENELIEKIKAIDEKITKVDTLIAASDEKLKDISNSINALRENESYHDYQESKNKVEIKIEKFLKQFDIVANYQSINEAISFIQKEWDDLEQNFKQREAENKTKIPVYKKISDYLQREEIITEDRKYYTKPLFNTVNLYGTTTTSRDKFDERSMSELEEYNLGELDLRKQGIDVVIIDEVSKSSFIELLIPILYGKTVILVGDHRQLPPMYEYRNFRDEDYEGLDEEIINPTINKRYTTMYEESFFKTLFERVPTDYKIMLTKQYRSHEQIMNVFNHFYNKNLELGDASQNSHKKHYLNIAGNQRLIIEQDKHIYFVDSKEPESRSEDSTSIQNRGEADIVIELLKKIDNAYLNNKDFNPRINKALRIDERMSVGVICTYGDQAQLIKQKRKSYQFKSFNEKTDSRLVISTVDDFQGDERDIIIVSMVRNPRDPSRSNPGFITAYQRINVAFSRARRLLIIVGNKDYLIRKGVIDLPDVMGDTQNDQKNFRVYEKIIDTIKHHGKVLDDNDIISEGKK